MNAMGKHHRGLDAALARTGTDADVDALREALREALVRVVGHAVNFHSFDAACEMADFDMAIAIVDACPEPDGIGLLKVVAQAIAAAEAATGERIAALIADQVKDCRRAGGGLYTADFIAGLAWANALILDARTSSASPPEQTDAGGSR